MPEPEVVQAPPVAPPPTVPSKAAVPLAQIVWLAPAFAVAALWTVTTRLCDCALHSAWLPVEVSVSVTAPAEASAAPPAW